MARRRWPVAQTNRHDDANNPLLMALRRTRMGLGRSQATELHGAYCGGHGTPFCPKDRRITTTPFKFKMPK